MQQIQRPDLSAALKREAAGTPKLSSEFLDGLKKILGMLAEHYRAEVPELSLVVYREGLRDLTLEQISRAALEAVKHSKFFPTVAELREALAIANERLPQAAAADCEECSGTGYKVVPTPGGYRQAVQCRHERKTG